MFDLRRLVLVLGLALALSVSGCLLPMVAPTTSPFSGDTLGRDDEADPRTVSASVVGFEFDAFDGSK